MIKKTITILFLTLLLLKTSFSQDNPPTRTVTINFKLDLSAELKKVRSVSSIGIRGNVAPLSWNHTYLMTDDDKDGIYETTIKLETADPNLRIKYKYFHDTASWEKGADRVIVARENSLMLPVDKWSIILKKNTAAYIDSMELHELSNTIIRLDSLLFYAYNHCEDQKYLEAYDAFFSEDHEFYHDRGGYNTSKAKSTEGVKNYVCGKTRRELLKGSIEVSPVPGYGAVEIGQHRFYNIAEKSWSGYAKFIVIWKNDNGQWKVTRVISLHK